SQVMLVDWFNEEELVNPEHPDPKQHIRLYTELRLQPKKLVCIPDAAFLLDVAGHRGVFYLEQDRDRDNYSHRRVAALKSPGYAFGVPGLPLAPLVSPPAALIVCVCWWSGSRGSPLVTHFSVVPVHDASHSKQPGLRPRHPAFARLTQATLPGRRSRTPPCF